MPAERWERMLEILTVIEIMNNENRDTSVKNITKYLQKVNQEIELNIVNSSIRHYRKLGLIKRKHKPYLKPFQYILTNKGYIQLDWLENEY